MQMEQTSTNQINYPIDVTKKWGVKISLNMENDDKVSADSALFKGRLVEITPFEEFNEILTFKVELIQGLYGNNKNLNEILKLPENEHLYTCFFPLYDIKKTSQEVADQLVASSGGWLKSFEFVMFENKSELIEWTMTNNLTYD